jgi:hypothetical protein
MGAVENLRGSRRGLRRRWSVLGVLGLLLVGPLLAGEAPAAGAAEAGATGLPPYLAPANDPAVTTLAEDLQIPVQDAQRRLGWQDPAMQLGEDLRRALGERFGGLWFDEADGGRVKVGVVGGSAAAEKARSHIARRQLGAVTDLVAVRHSYADLERASAWLSRATAKVNPRTKGARRALASVLLPDKNQVELQLPRGQRLNTPERATVREAKRRFGAMLALGSWSGAVVKEACVWNTDGFFCDPPLRGGVGIDDLDPITRTNCTTGFNARSKSDGKWYVLTAGHCGPRGGWWNTYIPRDNSFAALGVMHNRVDQGADDFGIITNPAPWYFSPGPYVYVELTPETTYAPLYQIRGVAGSAVGMRVCVSGAISGTDCGTVKALNWGGPGGFAVIDYCTTSGDSGAPVYSSGMARGIHIGAIPTPQPQPCVGKLYQGVFEAAQRLKVYVVTTAQP